MSKSQTKYLDRLMRRENMILEVSQEIVELKQELLQAHESNKNLLNKAKRTPNIITALSKTELDRKNEDAAMSVKSVMSYGLELVG